MSSGDFSAALQSAVAVLSAAIVNPDDGLRIFAQLAGFAPSVSIPPSRVGVAMGDAQDAVAALARRAAISALARASAAYQPASYDDAVAVRTFVCSIIDAEITVAGDNAEDATYNALRALRQAVVQDLTTRGGDLAPMRTFSVNAPMPAMVLAQRFYQDPSRADQITRQSGARHPAFMPLEFMALSR